MNALAARFSPLALLLTAATLADASVVTSFQRRHTIPGVAQSGADLLQTPDGGYVYVGTRALTPGHRQVTLTRTNAAGQPLWCRLYGAGPGITEGICMVQAPDGGYVLGCRTDGAAIPTNRILLIRTDPNGSVLGARAFDGLSLGRVRAAPSAGGFVIVGSKIIDGAGNGPGVLLTTDANLNQIAGVTYFNPSDPDSTSASLLLSDVAEDRDGAFYITGRQSLGGNSSRFLAMRTRAPGSPFGSVLWANDYFSAHPGFNMGVSVRRDRTGQAVFVGNASNSANPSARTAACRADAAGARLWANLYTGDFQPSRALELLSSGNLVFPVSIPAQDCGLFYLNGATGAAAWVRRFGDVFSNDSMSSVVATTDGGYAGVGFKYPGTASQTMLYKHNGQGWTGCVEAGYSTTSVNSPLTMPIPIGVGPLGPSCTIALELGEVQAVDEAFCYNVRCAGDYNTDLVVDFFDYLDFVADWDREAPKADFNNDFTVDFFDYLDFVVAYDSPC